MGLQLCGPGGCTKDSHCRVTNETIQCKYPDTNLHLFQDTTSPDRLLLRDGDSYDWCTVVQDNHKVVCHDKTLSAFHTVRDGNVSRLAFRPPGATTSKFCNVVGRALRCDADAVSSSTVVVAPIPPS